MPTKKKRPYCYEYPRPALTVDIVLLTVRGGRLETLLIRRGLAPFAGRWALPGGFVNEGESPLQAARRELKEETGVARGLLDPFGTFADPGRDPRGWTASVAHVAVVNAERLRARAADDASAVGWFDVDDLPHLAFDHAKIIRAALRHLRTTAAAHLRHSSLLEETFPPAAFTWMYGLLTRRLTHASRLVSRMVEDGVLTIVTGGKRPGRIYRFAPTTGAGSASQD
jgi:8-oxo-dGTP diphosphatase